MSDHSDTDSVPDLAFATLDLRDVDFENDDAAATDQTDQESAGASDDVLLEWEKSLPMADAVIRLPHSLGCINSMENLRQLASHLADGHYADILRSVAATRLVENATNMDIDVQGTMTVPQRLHQAVQQYGTSLVSCIELELIGIASLNLFYQANYTGPTVHDAAVADVNPHASFKFQLKASEGAIDPPGEEKTEIENDGGAITATNHTSAYQNAVLAELAVDGDWPCQVCNYPYMLLLARCILSTLAKASPFRWATATNLGWTAASLSLFDHCATQLQGLQLWHMRAVVAHQRLLPSRNISPILWTEVDVAFQKCQASYIDTANTAASEDVQPSSNLRAASVLLERGLTEHYFDRPGQGRDFFSRAKDRSGLVMEVTGAVGKRTKYQHSAIAQMLVKAESKESTQLALSSSSPTTVADATSTSSTIIKQQAVNHSDETILLDKVRYEDDALNTTSPLTTLDQCILLALCLDVKNHNPHQDVLSNEEMGAFLARVLDHHDDWMIYSTCLLERAWLEFDRSHTRERAILQLQALADQHTDRLTLTQSTTESVQESAPVQDRLRYLHAIVYPPRWCMLQDLADRYAALGIVTSAAELFTEIEMWDDVVDCYKRAGRAQRAEQIVRERLAHNETPRMWTALGDLTNEPRHYEHAIELSHGRFAAALVSLGHYYFDKGDLVNASANYGKAVKARPLLPFVWFRLGTTCMQLGRWDEALRAFSEVVQQEPEEADAWANVAAVHVHNGKPAEAYPAIVESLKHNRNNWRVWTTKLYICLDLQKYNEAIQACNAILDLREAHKSGHAIPELEEKCIRGIAGGAVRQFHESKDERGALDSSRRMLSRLQDLLDRLAAAAMADNMSWIHETIRFLHEQVGHDDEAILEHLMAEYRSLRAIKSWEMDNASVKRICQVVFRIAAVHIAGGEEQTKTHLSKAKMLLRSVVNSISKARPDDSTLPSEVARLSDQLAAIEKKLRDTPN